MNLLLSSPKCRLPLSSLLSSHKYQILSSTKYRLSSSLSSSLPEDRYKHFFPCYYNGYISHKIESFFSSDKTTWRNDITLDDDPRMQFPQLDQKEPHYDFELDATSSCSLLQPIKGDCFDVISMLSLHGDELVRIGANKTDFVKAECLRDKYIMVCCAFVPLIWMNYPSCIWRGLSNLNSELSQTNIGSNLEIVIVVKMRQKWDNDAGVFDHFLSAFPGCLAVPFNNKYGRDYICKSLDFEGREPSFVLVDPSGKVLQCSKHDPFFERLEDIVKYGARGFPFTERHIGYLSSEDNLYDPRVLTNKSLVGLLSCYSEPSSFLLRKFDSDETISIQELNKKHVGLYLMKRGDKLGEFHRIYQLCRDQGLDFEIVLVCLPMQESIHPKEFEEVVHRTLKKLRVSSWWVFPYDNSTCHRLYRLSYGSSDKMFIVGPHNKFVYKLGAEIIHHFCPHFGTEVYPFTRDALLQAFLRRLEKVTLESFLGYDYVYQDYECDSSKIIPVAKLLGKNIIVYMRNSTREISSDFLNEWYDNIKAKDSDFEVVFVPRLNQLSDDPELYSRSIKQLIHESKVKWLVCPFDEDPEHSKTLLYHDAFIPMKEFVVPTLVIAFGKDGHIHSLDVIHLLQRYGLDAYPFCREFRDEILCKEIIPDLHCEYEIFED